MKCLVKNHSNVNRWTGPVLLVHYASTTAKAMLRSQGGYCQAGFKVKLLGCWAWLNCSSTGLESSWEAKQTAPCWEVTQQCGHNPPGETACENVKITQRLWAASGSVLWCCLASVGGTFPPAGCLHYPKHLLAEVSDTAPSSKKGKSKTGMFSFFTEGFNHLKLRDKVMLHYWSK